MDFEKIPTFAMFRHVWELSIEIFLMYQQIFNVFFLKTHGKW
jgi:hypothetical protein